MRKLPRQYPPALVRSQSLPEMQRPESCPRELRASSLHGKHAQLGSYLRDGIEVPAAATAMYADSRPGPEGFGRPEDLCQELWDCMRNYRKYSLDRYTW